MDRFLEFALLAAKEALDQAGWQPAQRSATGANGHHHRLRSQLCRCHHRGGTTTDARGPRQFSSLTVPSFLANIAAGNVSIQQPDDLISLSVTCWPNSPAVERGRKEFFASRAEC